MPMGEEEEREIIIERESGESRMQKVPAHLKQELNRHDYEPLVVALGPYHHGKQELKLAEEFKPKALRMFAEDSGKTESFFFDKVLGLINHAKNCYIIDDSLEKYFDNPTFARMMLLDASFIINYIVLSENQKMSVVEHLGNWGFGQIIRDMLLLENQIPFSILKHLMCLGYGNANGEAKLNQFLNRNTFVVQKSSGIASTDNEPLHLLAAFRLTFLGDYKTPSPEQAKVACLAKFPWSTRRKEENDKYSERPFIQSFRCVTDLKAKGIHFSPSNVDSLRSFEFKSGYFSAKLKVPVTIASVYSKVVWLNIIAYEMCEKTRIDVDMTAYVEFMKSLIDNPVDVKELRDKKILLSSLTSDEEVVKVFNEIGPYGFYYTDSFQEVKQQIQAHYNSKVKTWLAELIHTYFRSPWTAVALFAATFLIILTLLQTIYTMKSGSNE